MRPPLHLSVPEKGVPAVRSPQGGPRPRPCRRRRKTIGHRVRERIARVSGQAQIPGDLRGGHFILLRRGGGRKDGRKVREHPAHPILPSKCRGWARIPRWLLRYGDRRRCHGACLRPVFRDRGNPSRAEEGGGVHHRGAEYRLSALSDRVIVREASGHINPVQPEGRGMGRWSPPLLYKENPLSAAGRMRIRYHQGHRMRTVRKDQGTLSLPPPGKYLRESHKIVI